MLKQLKRLLEFVVSPHFFELVAFALGAAALSFALSPDREDVLKAHWFFGAAFLLAIGRVAHLMFTWKETGFARYFLAFALFGLIGFAWIAIYDWTEGKLAKLEKVEPAVEVARHIPPPQQAALGLETSPSGGSINGGKTPTIKHEAHPTQNQPPTVTGTIETTTPRRRDELSGRSGVQSSQPQPPPVIETAPAFGNIKERAIALSEEIMQDLYMHGWNERDPRVPHVMPPVEHMKMPPAATVEQMEDWNRRRSNKFRFTFFARVLDIRNEFAQLHLRDKRLDQLVDEEERVAQANEQLAAAGKQGQINILPQEIEEVAERLKVLAVQVPVTRAAPTALHFSEKQISPENPDFPLRMPGSPYRIVVTVETQAPVSSGYIVVEFDDRWGSVSCDFIDARLVSGGPSDAEDIGNKEFLKYLATLRPPTYALALGKTPFLPGRPLHVFASGKDPFHVTKVTLFDE